MAVCDRPLIGGNVDPRLCGSFLHLPKMKNVSFLEIKPPLVWIVCVSYRILVPRFCAVFDQTFQLHVHTHYVLDWYELC